jgi:hypothetical protein
VNLTGEKNPTGEMRKGKWWNEEAMAIINFPWYYKISDLRRAISAKRGHLFGIPELKILYWIIL